MLSVRQSRRQRGASMVELALVLFILLLLVSAIADFGRVFNSYVVINNASREGARYATRDALLIGDLEAEEYREAILQAVKDEAKGSSVDLEECETSEFCDIEIDPDPRYGLPQKGDPIAVTVSYEIPTIIADITGFGYLPLRARTEMRARWWADES